MDKVDIEVYRDYKVVRKRNKIIATGEIAKKTIYNLSVGLIKKNLINIEIFFYKIKLSFNT